MRRRPTLAATNVRRKLRAGPRRANTKAKAFSRSFQLFSLPAALIYRSRTTSVQHITLFNLIVSLVSAFSDPIDSFHMIKFCFNYIPIFFNFIYIAFQLFTLLSCLESSFHFLFRCSQVRFSSLLDLFSFALSCLASFALLLYKLCIHVGRLASRHSHLAYLALYHLTW